MSESLPRFPLPVLRDEPPVPRQRRPWQGVLLHLVRLGMFAVLLLIVRQRHREFLAREAARELTPIDVDRLLEFYPTASGTGDVDPDLRTQTVLDVDGERLGVVLQTSPQSDHIIGFSGPTNVLVAFDAEEHIVGAAILSSRDTQEHAALVRRDPNFLRSWNGLTWDEAAAGQPVDAVTGATLTSLAITESIATRLRGSRPAPPDNQEPPNLRFPDSPTVDDVAVWFPAADRVAWSEQHPSQYEVLDAGGTQLGRVFRTTPAADAIIGYQGPTDTLVGLNPDGRVVGIRVRKSFDNEPYVGYIRDEDYFLNLFNGKSLQDLAGLDLFEERVEGVSGATMTSLAVAEGLVKTAGLLHELQLERELPTDAAAEDSELSIASSTHRQALTLSLVDVSSIVVTGLAALLALTRLRSRPLLRAVFQVVLVVWLGFWCGSLTSLATLFGWAQSGVPWQFALGLTVVTAAALLCPAVSRTQLYCHHLCPHGALQQLVRNRLPFAWQPDRRLRAVLQLLPFGLLVWAILLTLLGLPYSLVDLEAFDAYVLRAAGIATLTIFVVGLLASLVTPMAYCRFGCPTGAVLEFVRFHSSSDRWRRRDWMAIGLLGLAVVLWLLPLPPEDPSQVLRPLLDASREFADSNSTALKWLAIGSALMFVGSLSAVPWLVGLIPEDYFLTQRRPRTRFRQHHPAVALTLRIFKNLFGAVFLLAGLAMIVLPGQGLLTILAGVLLLEFPGKRHLERALIRRHSVLKAVNWIRRRRGRPEIRVD
ncbi:MAG: FMN-binding protein [Planctomycetota bacterium]|jgi:Na+-translocating ferredoxin:NAD+ oxidoreductase RnfG subunit